ncbi:MAG: cytochrome c oxidase subunit II [Thermoguttaceae bacterium]|jgi:cytochrome c oxidase subunit 2
MRPNLLAQSTFWLEPAASTSAQRHDVVFYTVLYTATFFFLVVVGLMLLFILMYRRRKEGEDRHGPTHNTWLEIVWTAIPVATVTVLFIMGFRGFLDLDTPPSEADVLDVEARQWAFSFTYPNGATSENLYLRVGRPVIVQLHSADVLHSLYIPAFRVQKNAVPGRTEQLWFQPTELGTYYAFCSQYCGNGHSRMTADVEVLDETAYSARMAALSNIFVDPATKKPLPYAEVGAKLYKSNGCSQCHSVERDPDTHKGKLSEGPTWVDLYKREEQFSVPPGFKLSPDDSDATWDAYLRESILDPGAKIVRGYQNIMQPFADRFSGSGYKEKKLTALVEYIKSLDGNGPGYTPKYYRPMPVPAEAKENKKK